MLMFGDDERVLPPAEFSYVVVEGPIGVGKTTLARRLARSYDAEEIFEAPAENPFLPRFYENPDANALATQLYFLLQRVRQLQALRQRDLFARTRVGDYLIDKDRIFAELTLGADELTLYNQVYEEIVGDPVRPDLVIYLQAPVDVLLARIASRAIPYEAAVDAEYLQRLNAAYTRFFYHYDDAPLLMVDTSEADYVNRRDDLETVLDLIRDTKPGRRHVVLESRAG